MFDEIFIEEAVLNNQYTKRILTKLKRNDFRQIRKIEDIFGVVKKPYLQKRDGLNLFIGEKLGERVKEAPNAYGVKGEKHYYFVHAYNCIYECEYCYLQGYFNSPDIVLFVNHNEIIADMQQILDQNPNEQIWFHAGEFSDSLALSHLTGELEAYWAFFKQNSHAKLEIRSKSANIKEILNLTPQENCIISFSFSSELAITTFDHKTAGLKGRLAAINELSKKGYQIGIHFDPIIYQDNFKVDYLNLTELLVSNLKLSQLNYLSLGVVRFSKEVFHDLEINYPKSSLLAQEFITSTDGKVKYKRPHRLWMLEQIKQICIENGIAEKKIYFCMEND